MQNNTVKIEDYITCEENWISEINEEFYDDVEYHNNQLKQALLEKEEMEEWRFGNESTFERLREIITSLEDKLDDITIKKFVLFNVKKRDFDATNVMEKFVSTGLNYPEWAGDWLFMSDEEKFDNLKLEEYPEDESADESGYESADESGYESADEW